jgi:urea transport system permease protein
LVLSVPALVAFIFGFFAFRSKIKGVYFSIITQAMTFAAALLFFRNETGFGGNNGFTGFKTLLGFDITSAPMRATLCFVTALVLMLCFIGLRQLMNRPMVECLARFVTAKTVCNIWAIARCGTSFQHGYCPQ